MKARLRTNAKVNLFLHVMGQRPDGFHEVETILHGIKLADDIEIETTDTGRVEVDMQLTPGVVGELPAAERNSAYLAALQLIGEGDGRGARISIIKRIPMGAGLGGGSGNAAGVLVVLNELWKLGHDSNRLLELAAAVGSDVPYCIGGGTALAKGRGEQVTRIPGPADLWFVLGLSDEPLATGRVYAAWDEVNARGEASSAAMTLALGAGDPGEIAGELHNDLEPLAFHLRPELKAKKSALVEAGALGASLSGSGATIFAIAADEADAHRMAAAVRGAFDRVVVVRSQPECIERLD